MHCSSLLLARRAFLASAAAALLAASARGAHADAVAIDAEIADVRLRYGLPGVVAMVLRSGAVVAQGVSGVRSVTTSVPVLIDDRFVLGSCGKSMTATIAARLAARGAVRFETTLAEAFPELAPGIQPAYHGATLESLLAHRSAIPQVPPVPVPLRGDPATERARALPVILTLPPQRLPGQTFLYSNLGYIVAGAGARAAGQLPFEALAAAAVPAARSGDGGVRAAGRRGAAGPHRVRAAAAAGVRALSAGQACPAGLFHLSLPDWARYALVHMGLGPTDYLPPELLARLQRPWAPDLGESYALGWHVAPGNWGIELRHNGSDGYWSARIRLVPALGYAVLMATNMLGFNVEPAAEELEARLMQRFPPA